MLSKISQSKAKYHMISLTCGILWENELTIKIEINSESRLTAIMGRGVGRLGVGAGIEQKRKP